MDVGHGAASKIMRNRYIIFIIKTISFNPDGQFKIVWKQHSARTIASFERIAVA